MANERILVVEDEEDILELISFNLTKQGYTVIGAETGEDGLAQVASARPHMVLLDLMLPGIDGLEVLRRMKSDPAMQDISVIIVSAMGEEVDVVTGLELGADDYVAKPFRPRELVARVRTVLRGKGRQEAKESDVLSVEGIELDRARREMRLDGTVMELTYTEFEILYLLARRRGLVFTRYQIVDAVRGEDYAVTDRSVDVQIAGLRKKLGEAGSLIQTVRNVGYRFKGQE